MENETTPTPAQVVKNIYTCLEMLTAANRDDLHSWWCSLLYAPNGDINYPMWSTLTLVTLENDVIYNT
jgi:hypothetical protein